MNGAEHFTWAEVLLGSLAELVKTQQPVSPEHVTHTLATAQVHATLALAAASAWPVVDRYKGDSDLTNTWSDAIGWGIAVKPYADDVVDAEIHDADCDRGGPCRECRPDEPSARS